MTEAENMRTKILMMVCEAFGCTKEQIIGKSKVRQLRDARCVYSYIVRHHLGDTFMRIGMDLNRDHSSIVYQFVRMHDMIYVNDPTARVLKRIENELITKQLI